MLAEHLVGLLLAPFVGHRGGDPEGLLPSRCGEDRPEVRPELLAARVAHHPEEVPGVVDLAPLVGSSLEVASDRCLEALVVVADDQLDTRKSPPLEGSE